MTKFIDRFFVWQNYAHYLLLALILSFVASYFGALFTSRMFVITFVALLVGDSLVHGLFFVLPKPFKWSD